MAKKDFSFDDINAELKALNPMGSVMADSTFSEVTEWIDTGNYHLNACVSGSLFGGWPNSRTCSIAGPSGTGKTFLVLNSVQLFLLLRGQSILRGQLDFDSLKSNLSYLNLILLQFYLLIVLLAIDMGLLFLCFSQANRVLKILI